MTDDTTHKPAGRVMALDLGEKRIGVALSDPTRTIASAHSVLTRKSRLEDSARYAHLIAENGVTLLVLGLPITLGRQEGTRAAWVRDYAADLAGRRLGEAAAVLNALLLAEPPTMDIRPWPGAWGRLPLRPDRITVDVRP